VGLGRTARYARRPARSSLPSRRVIPRLPLTVPISGAGNCAAGLLLSCRPVLRNLRNEGGGGPGSPAEHAKLATSRALINRSSAKFTRLRQALRATSRTELSRRQRRSVLVRRGKITDLVRQARRRVLDATRRTGTCSGHSKGADEWYNAGSFPYAATGSDGWTCFGPSGSLATRISSADRVESGREKR